MKRTAESSEFLLRGLSAAVHSIALEGMGTWDRTWTIVDAPSAEFLIALSAFESDPCPKSRARVDATTGRLIEAWRDAAAQFELERAT